MEVLQGIGVSSGVAIGPVYILGREEIVLTSRKVQPEEVPGEIERFRQALLLATEDVSHIREISLSKMPPKYAAIFDAHIAILKDPSLSREIEGFVRERLVVAEHAVSRVFRKYIATLELIDQEYLSQRADDLRDLERRVIAHLAGTRNRGLEKIDTKVILISRYLTPSETATLSKDRILGIATDMGGLTSHASILARALEIPAVVGLRTISNHVSVGDIVIIDGFRGRAIISPNETTVEQYRLMQRDFVYTRYLADLDKMKPCVTEDGVTCSVMANIDHPDEIQTCLDHGASGVGLFRTEFLYLNRTTLPTEEEQYALYSQAIAVADGHQITFRTFDIGADKMPIGSINAEQANPALGLRAIRLARVMSEMFRSQLRAMLRAAADWAKKNRHSDMSNVKIMFPMVSHSSEFVWAKLQIKSIRDQLYAEGVRVPRELQIGAMLEVPAIFLAAEHLISRADFLSIGTNDLIQYLFAVDRTNEDVSYLYTPSHQSVLILLQMLMSTVSTSGLRKTPPISVCGEMAADPLTLVLLLGIGIREVSVSVPTVPLIKHIIRSISVRECRDIASRALAQTKPDIDLTVVRQYLNERMSDLFAGSE